MMMKRFAVTALAAAATFTTATIAPAAVTPAAAQAFGVWIGTPQPQRYYAPPPPPRYYAPPVQRVWVPGYWTWHHGRQVWVDGRWVKERPVPAFGPGWSPGWG